MIDFHTHILPGIDDGAKTVEDSIKMLKRSYEKGVRLTVLTPHFYPKGQASLDAFLKKRAAAFENLKAAMEGETDIPEVRLGCEVNISTDISEYDGIEQLAIEGTDYILLEIPHDTGITEDLCDRIYNVKYKNMTPIMAHIDRYLPIPKKFLKDLSDLNLLYQVNADAFSHFGIKKEIAKLFTQGFVHVLGSDMHNVGERDNNLDKAIEELSAHFSEEHIKFLTENAEAVINNESAHLRWHKYLPEISTLRLLFGKKNK